MGIYDGDCIEECDIDSFETNVLLEEVQDNRQRADDSDIQSPGKLSRSMLSDISNMT